MLLVTTPLCLALLLTGCNGKNLTHVNDAFKGSKPVKIEKKMTDETSHMAKAASKDVELVVDEKEEVEEKIEDVTGDTPAYTDNKIIPIPDRPKPTNFNNKNIFSQNLKSDGVRLDRLERAVQDMRNDFDNVSPAIRRLMAIEGEMQTLISELKKVNEGVSAPAPVVSTPQNIINTKPIGQKTPPVAATPAPAPKAEVKAPPKIETKTPPPVTGQAAIYDVRVGEHPGKTRIVMDVNSKAEFSVDIDNSEKIMIVEFPKAGWSANTARNFAGSPYIASYKAEAAGDGTLVIFQLKQAAKVAYKDDLKGASGTSRRVVIDVAGN